MSAIWRFIYLIEINPALTHDIVWLEEHEVMGEKVLVPVLYLLSYTR